MRKFYYTLLILASAITILPCPMTFAQVAAAPRQLFVIKPGADLLLITWVAAIMNKGQSPEPFVLPVLMPREAKDWQPLEGIAADDLKLAEAGLSVEKVFPPGVNVISVAFTVPAAFGAMTLNIKASSDVGELTIMTPRGMLDIRGRDFADAGTDVQDMQRYSVLTSNRMILTGETLQLDVRGIPEGRGRLRLLGGGFGVILLVGAALLTKKTIASSKSNAPAV